MKIHKGDQVLIISGKDRGKTGRLLQVFPKENRVIVENINIRKKSVKPKRAGEKGQTVEKASPIQASNVKLICPKCKKASKIRYKTVENKKFRICKKCSQEI